MREGEEYSSMTMSKAEEPQNTIADAEPAPAKKEPLAKQLLKQFVGIALALGLLYFSFRGQDLNKLWSYAQTTDLKYVGLMVVSGILSHVVRAWRWIILLKPLSEKSISLWNSFSAVMYGYAVNLVIPRGGEVARLVAISKSESIPWAGVLPTMFVDRLLDIAMLVLLVGLTMTKLPPGMLDARLTGPTGILMCVATVVGLAVLPFVGKIGRGIVSLHPVKKLIPQAVFPKIDQLLLQFDLGTRALTNVMNLLGIAALSLLIWFFYYMNLFLMVRAFHLENAIDFSKSLVIFTISSVSVLIPTPGSVGGYHYFTSQALQKVAGVNATESLAYAAVSHLLSFVIVTCVPAAICFIIQSFRTGKKA